MRVAVDASALARGGDGISRYLRLMLRELLMRAPEHDWRLYGRHPDRDARLQGATGRYDRLPPATGAAVSLFTTQVFWAARERPDLFWAPAHRLPWSLPRATARVLTVHDLCYLAAPSSMRRTTRMLDATLMPRAISRSDRIACVSQSTAEQVAERFPAARERIAVVHPGVAPLPAAAARSTLEPLGITGPYVLFVGTREPRKNLARLAQAFARAASGSDARLVLAGARGWGDADGGASATTEVITLGHVDDAQLATLYRHARLLALPSLYEGFGLPLVEAMAVGTPVLTSRTASMPEVAGDAGLLVDPLSVDSIAEGLHRLLHDDALHAQLARAAPAQAARFDWNASAQRMLTLFAQARSERR
jgi:glycosyltransferase involved in cell wall biosynthesis